VATLLLSLGLAMLTPAGASSTALAAQPQSDAQTTAERALPAVQEKSSYWAVVTANDVHVRSGPSVDAAYPYLKLDRGALVRVTEENVGWARVPAIGPSFKEAFGYVKADRKIRVSADGRTAEVLSTVDVLAPNHLARFAPDSSWKSIGQLEPGRTIAVLDTIEGQREKVHKIRLTEQCEGWLNLTFLRPASEQELLAIDPATGGPRSVPPAQPEGSATTPAGAPGGASRPAATEGASATVTVLPAEPAAEEVVEGEVIEVTEISTSPGQSTPSTPGKTPSAPTAASLEERLQRVTLSDLEAAMERLRREDPVTAEVGPLRLRFLEFADRPESTANQRQFALARAEQLSIQEEAQVRLQQVQALLNRNNADLEILRNARQSMDARQPYIAVGRLNASTVYDGIRLPLLFRVQDPAGGQTIGYIEPGKGFDLTAMLGQLVGIVGKQGYDSALRLNTIEPSRIDVLGVKR